MPFFASALALLAPLAPLPPQADFVPLESADEDDRPVDAVFGRNDRYLFLAHSSSGSVTRLDLATGIVDLSVDLGLSASAIALTAGGARAVVLDGLAPAVHLVELPSLQLVRSVQLSIAAPFALHPDVAGTRLAVEGQTAASVVDLTAGVESRTIALPLLSSPQPSGPRAHLAVDDRTLVFASDGALGGVDLRSVDITTGGATGSVNAPIAPASIGAFVASGDRRVVVLESHRFSPAEVRYDAYDPLALGTPVTTRLAGATAAQVRALSRDGTRAFWYRSTDLQSFPLNGLVVTSATPGFVSTAAPGLARLAISADETRWLLLDFAGRVRITDAAGTPLGTFDPGDVVPERAVPSSNGAQFALFSPWRERVATIAAGGAAPSLGHSVNTGFGEEVDGPFPTALLAGERSAVVTAMHSDRILFVDLDSGSVTSALDAAREPWLIERAADDRVLVGHSDGTLIVVDAVARTECGRVALGGPVVDVVPVPGSTRAWVRTEPGGGSALALVETGGPQPGIVTSTGLSVGGANVRALLLPAARGTLAVDHAHALAYVLSPTAGSIEVVDLSTTPPTTLVAGSPTAITNDRGSLTLSPDGLVLYGVTSGSISQVDAWDTPPATGGGLGLRWTKSLQGAIGSGSTSLGLSADGATLLVDLTGIDIMGAQLGPGVVTLRADDGVELDPLGVQSSTGLVVASDRTVVSAGTELHYARLNGSTLVDRETITAPRVVGGPAAISAAQGLVAAQAPDVGYFDGLEGLVIFDLLASRTTVACTGGAPNATGAQAELRASGSAFAGEALVLTVSGLQPNSMFGMLVVGSALVPPTPAGSGIGQFCVGGSIGRLTTQVQLASAAGEHRYLLDTDAVPTSVGVLSFQPGTSWTFQGWHRDQAPGGPATSNTSTALQVRFR